MSAFVIGETTNYNVTVHGSVCSFCVRLCGWTRSLCLSALHSDRAPEEVIRTVTGVARLHCLYLAGVFVVRCQIVFTLVVSYSLCQSSRSGGCSRLVAFQYSLKAGDSALPGLLHLHCRWYLHLHCVLEYAPALPAYLHLHCVLELSNKDYLFFTRNWISGFLNRDRTIWPRWIQRVRQN